MSSANPIEESFERAAARCEDLTPLVYARLHPEYPETLALFRTEGSELVKGSMLAMTIESILDFAGPCSGKFRMIECELSSHDARARSAKVGTGFASDRALAFEPAHGLIAKPHTLWRTMRWHAARPVRRVFCRDRRDLARGAWRRMVAADRCGMAAIAGRPSGHRRTGDTSKLPSVRLLQR